MLSVSFIAPNSSSLQYFQNCNFTREKNYMNNSNKYVEIKTDMAGRVPVFKGTRVSVKTLLTIWKRNRWKSSYWDFQP